MGAVVFVASFAVYAVFAAPALGWLDSSEFIAAGASLGVPHSPGHPLQAILSRLATLLPFGDVAIRVNLLSALAMATANTLLFGAACELAADIADQVQRWQRQLVAAALTASVGLSAASWVQAGRAEVYALHTALLALCLLFALRYRRNPVTGNLAAFALASGLSLATHHFIALTWLVPLSGLMLWSHRPRLRGWGMACGFGALGLSVLLYLPLRAAADPILNWGNPDTLGRFWWTLSGQAFSGAVGEAHTSPMSTDMVQALAAIFAGTPALLVTSLLAIYMVIRGGRGGAIAITAIASLLLTVTGRALLGFDPETPDHYAYLLPALLALMALSAAGLAALLGFLPAPRRALAAVTLSAMVVALTTIGVATGLDETDQRDHYAADTIARLTIDSPPPRALVITSYFQTSFRATALQAAEGARPDLTFVDRSFLSYPGEREAVLARAPELAELIAAGLEPGRPAPAGALAKIANLRPVLIELHFNLDPSYHSLMALAGVFAQFGHRATSMDQAHYLELESIRDRARGSDRDWAQLHLLWTDYVQLIHACKRGTMADATRIYSRAQEFAAGDPMFDELATSCGIAETHSPPSSPPP